MSLTEEEVKSGKYGKIIPEGAKVIPPGASIYDFSDHKKKDAKGTRIHKYPGFLKRDRHPDGKCLPCCFKGWDSHQQRERREECAKDDVPHPTSRQDPEMADDYIKGPDKFPLETQQVRISTNCNTEVSPYR